MQCSNRIQLFKRFRSTKRSIFTKRWWPSDRFIKEGAIFMVISALLLFVPQVKFMVLVSRFWKGRTPVISFPSVSLIRRSEEVQNCSQTGWISCFSHLVRGLHLLFDLPIDQLSRADSTFGSTLLGLVLNPVKKHIAGK